MALIHQYRGLSLALMLSSVLYSTAMAENEHTPIFVSPPANESTPLVEFEEENLPIAETFELDEEPTASTEDEIASDVSVPTSNIEATSEEPSINSSLPTLINSLEGVPEADASLPIELYDFQVEFYQVWFSGYTEVRATRACERRRDLKKVAYDVSHAPVFDMISGGFDSWIKQTKALEALVVRIAEACPVTKDDQLPESEINDLLVKTNDIWNSLLRMRSKISN